MNSITDPVSFIFLLVAVHITKNTEVVIWCTFNSADFKKCQSLSHDFVDVGYLAITCQEEQTSANCVKYVSSSPQSMMTLDAGYLYHGQSRGNEFKIVLSEYNGISKIWSNLVGYYSVALVKAGNLNLELLDLEGTKICHGEYDAESSSGWDIALSLLSYHGELSENSRCNIVDRINRYFGASCLPSPSGVLSDSLRTCQACSSGSCSRETKYRGSSGALRCLVDGAGDVAFLRYDTIFRYLGDKSGEDWAAGLNARDFRLLCPDGRQTTVDKYEWCHTGIMMPNSLIVNGNMSDKMVSQIQHELRNPPPQTKKYMFDSAPYSVTSNNVLFSNDTVELVPVRGVYQDPRNFLDQYGDRWNPSYLRAMDSLYCNVAPIPTVCLKLLLMVGISCLII